MVIFNFSRIETNKRKSKPCVRINIDNPSIRKEYPSAYAAAKDNGILNGQVLSCCERNLNQRTLRYRVHDWYFIYKDD